MEGVRFDEGILDGAHLDFAKLDKASLTGVTAYGTSFRDVNGPEPLPPRDARTTSTIPATPCAVALLATALGFRRLNRALAIIICGQVPL